MFQIYRKKSHKFWYALVVYFIFTIAFRIQIFCDGTSVIVESISNFILTFLNQKYQA